MINLIIKYFVGKPKNHNLKNIKPVCEIEITNLIFRKIF